MALHVIYFGLIASLYTVCGCAYTWTKLGSSNDASSSQVDDATSTNTPTAKQSILPSVPSFPVPESVSPPHTGHTTLPTRTTQSVVPTNIPLPISSESNTRLLQSPTMPELVSFTLDNGKSIDISAEIGSRYREFGWKLLEDNSGKRVENIAYVKFEEAKETNQRILQKWREGAGRRPVTWGTLIEVLNELNMSKLAARIESSVDLTRRPDMPEFVTLILKHSNGEAINIAAEIGHLSLTFGILLLNDTNGKITEGLAHGKRLPKDISVDILKEWLKGIGRKPTTWKILVDTLKQIGLAELGNDIETSL